MNIYIYIYYNNNNNSNNNNHQCRMYISYYMYMACSNIKKSDFHEALGREFVWDEVPAEAGCHGASVEPRCGIGLLGPEADAQTGGWS